MLFGHVRRPTLSNYKYVQAVQTGTPQSRLRESKSKSVKRYMKTNIGSSV